MADQEALSEQDGLGHYFRLLPGLQSKYTRPPPQRYQREAVAMGWVNCRTGHKDIRFVGLRVSRDPDWLNQAPPTDLEDALQG
jgi:hypothetical protein